MPTVAHITHEAVQKIGGIGAVLNGLLTSKTYLSKVDRNILVGPYWPGEGYGDGRLGPAGEVLYSGMDHIARTPLAGRLADVERQFDVRLIYGRRKFIDKDTGVTSNPEILLIDVSTYNGIRIGHFKFRLWESFGIDSGRYEHVWDFEQYMRLAEPTIAVLQAIGAEPAVVLSHEYMGMPTALAAIVSGGDFRTVFHAHECATMRRIIEAHPGQDTYFYNVMRQATAVGQTVDEAFGDQSDYYKHALIKATSHCDNIFAVGDDTLAEMRFLSHAVAAAPAQVAYNGVPHWAISIEQKLASRNRLREYGRRLTGDTPDFVFTHVTRLVPSKGLWRDLKVLAHVERILRERNETAILFTLSTEVPGRKTDAIHRMENDYGWPIAHREGGTDLSGGEADYYAGVQAFNARSRNVKVVFLNQFGFDPTTCGRLMPDDMEFMDIRKGSDVEFGQSIYEPFGIAQVEPISFGGICVMTALCGCAGFVHRITGGRGTPNVIVADYTRTDADPATIGKGERERVEAVESERIAAALVDRLPRTDTARAEFLQRGFELASHMSWDAVARDYILPGLEVATAERPVRRTA